MKKRLWKCAFTCYLVGLAGCASIDFYEEQNDQTLKEVGFLYYPPKPYLLIETKNNITTTSILSLPDLSRPHRVKQDNGWGSAELGFEIENGMIKSFNSKTDSKGPETLTSLASLGTAKAGLITAQAALTAENSSASDAQLLVATNKGSPHKYEVKVFVEGADTLKTKVIPNLDKRKSNFSHEIESINQVINILESNQKINFDPNNPDAFLIDVEERRKLAKKQADILKNVSSTLTVYAENSAEQPRLILIAKQSNIHLKKVIGSLLKFALRSSSIDGLYEIKYTKGRINLRKVVFE